MKKYFMLIITMLMLLFTIAVYTYENNGQAPQIKQPSVSIDSKKFGQIKKIVWINKFMDNKQPLIILSTRNTEQGEMSYLYRLNIDTGKSDLLAEFPSHKNLNNVILFDAAFGPRSIIAAYDAGVIKISYPTDNPSSAAQDRIMVTGFETATSMDLKGKLIYTRENDKLLYVKNLPSVGFSGFFNFNNNIKDLTTYYAKPFFVGNLNSLDNILTYTSINKSQLDLYAMKNGIPLDTLNKPIIKNVVSVQGIEDSFGFAGMNILSEPKNNTILNLFMIRRTIDKYNNDDYYSLDTILYNTDPFGAVPALDSTTYNEDFSLAYTSYDENHKGSLKICGYGKKPRVIVSGENIFGPISMSDANDTVAYILYFTWDNNNIKIKVCDENGKLVRDITDMILD